MGSECCIIYHYNHYSSPHLFFFFADALEESYQYFCRIFLTEKFPNLLGYCCICQCSKMTSYFPFPSCSILKTLISLSIGSSDVTFLVRPFGFHQPTQVFHLLCPQGAPAISGNSQSVPLLMSFSQLECKILREGTGSLFYLCSPSILAQAHHQYLLNQIYQYEHCNGSMILVTSAPPCGLRTWLRCVGI